MKILAFQVFIAPPAFLLKDVTFHNRIEFARRLNLSFKILKRLSSGVECDSSPHALWGMDARNHELTSLLPYANCGLSSMLHPCLNLPFRDTTWATGVRQHTTYNLGGFSGRRQGKRVHDHSPHGWRHLWRMRNKFPVLWAPSSLQRGFPNGVSCATIVILHSIPLFRMWHV